MVAVKEQTFYRVDACRNDTDGRQETFKSWKEAEKRAREIAVEFGTNGKEGFSFPAELRGLALTADKMLRPHGKTLLQAVALCLAHPEADKPPVPAQQWYESKKGGRAKHLRPTTLRGIMESAETLKKLFPVKPVLEVTAADIHKYLDSLDVELRRKFNVRSRLSQFFNWCIAHSHLTVNPCEKIDVHVESKEVAENARVSWRYLQELEAGKGTNSSLAVLCGLKTALDCSWDELLTGMP